MRVILKYSKLNQKNTKREVIEISSICCFSICRGLGGTAWACASMPTISSKGPALSDVETGTLKGASTIEVCTATSIMIFPVIVISLQMLASCTFIFSLSVTEFDLLTATTPLCPFPMVSRENFEVSRVSRSLVAPYNKVNSVHFQWCISFLKSATLTFKVITSESSLCLFSHTMTLLDRSSIDV